METKETKKISITDISEKIYKLDERNLLKSAVEKSKEIAAIEATLEEAMTGLDNDGRFFVLAQVNRKIEREGQSFVTSTGINIDKIKVETNKISKQKKEEIIANQNINKGIDNQDKKEIEKSVKEREFNEKVEKNESLIEKYGSDVPGEVRKSLAKRAAQSETDRENIRKLMQEKGLSEEDAINEYFDGNENEIKKYKRTVNMVDTVNKAEVSGNPQDVEATKSRVDEELRIEILEIEIINLEREIRNKKVGMEQLKVSMEANKKNLPDTEKMSIKRQIEDYEDEIERMQALLEARKREKEALENDYEIRVIAEKNGITKEEAISRYFSGDTEKINNYKEAMAIVEADERLKFETQKAMDTAEKNLGKKTREETIEERRKEDSVLVAVAEQCIDNKSIILPENKKIDVSLIKSLEDIYLLESQGISKETIADVVKSLRVIFMQCSDAQEFSQKFIEGLPDEYKEIFAGLANMDFGDSLDRILEGDSDVDIFEKLDGIYQSLGLDDKDAEVGDTNIVDQTQAQPLPEEVSAELNAIPVALQRINCSPEDIAKGMEAYKQIIDGLTPEEIAGAQGNITEILQKAVEELGLEDIVGDILKMMSQITFNGQISEILKNSKLEFLNMIETISLQGPLLDPRVFAVNPEQHPANPTGSAPTERIDEDTLESGFAALAVDLQIADQTIIRPEELVADGVDQRKEDQVEVSDTAEHEEKKDNTENTIIKKLQTFFGVYQSARTSESDLEEEIVDLELASQKMKEDMQVAQNGQVVQTGNKPLVQPETDEIEQE